MFSHPPPLPSQSLPSETIFSSERDRSKVATHELSAVLYGGEEEVEKKRRVQKRMEVEYAHLFDRRDRPHQGPAERYTSACQKILNFRNVLLKAGEGDSPVMSLDEIYDHYLCVEENLPLDVHLSMFIPSLMYHTNAAQRAAWLPAALQFKMLGTYAQTELSHGSNVRGIQTTATYDANTCEFILHTPCLEAYKWWPGGLALTATHAVVMANLVIPFTAFNREHNTRWVKPSSENNDDCLNLGPHAFLVQIRSQQTHRLMPGIHTGVIGSKLGYNSMDNGFARFDSVRVPRRQMLMGYATVDRQGRYFKKADASKIAFGIMLDVRTRICRFSSFALAKALTIAIRYSCVRRQGFDDKKNKSGKQTMPNEIAVLDYPLQRQLLFPLLGLCFALHFAGRTINNQYRLYIASSGGDVGFDLEASEAELLAAQASVASGENKAEEWPLETLHAVTATIKAFATDYVSDGIETCRRACGGHGFLVNAGFTELLLSYLPANTYEGTKEVLSQQGGKYLLKKYMQAKYGKLAASSKAADKNGIQFEFITKENIDRLSRLGAQDFNATTSDFSHRSGNNIENLIVDFVRAFELRCLWLVSVVADQFVAQSGGKPRGGLMLHISRQMYDCTEAFFDLLVIKEFANKILSLIREKASFSFRPTIDSLVALFTLLSLHFMNRGMGSFLLSNVLKRGIEGQVGLGSVTSIESLSSIFPKTLASRGSISELFEWLLGRVRPDAVNLIESFLVTDYSINSTLGASSGNVYEKLYAEALKDPLNNYRSVKSMSETSTVDSTKSSDNAVSSESMEVCGEVSEGYSLYLRHIIDPKFSAAAVGSDLTYSKY